MIIDQPVLVPLWKRLGWGGLTLLCWALWMYLWMPLFTLGASGLGLYHGSIPPVWEEEAKEVKRLLPVYSMIVAAFGGSLLSWALSDYMRFRRTVRRGKPLGTLPQELACYLEWPVDEVADLQKARCVIAHHDEEGALSEAEVLVTEQLISAVSVAGAVKCEELEEMLAPAA